MNTHYNVLYSWAPLALRMETSSMTTLTRIRAFRRHQTLCKSNETDVTVIACDGDEPICRDDNLFPISPQKFTYMYVTLFEKLGLRLPFNTFEKELLTILNVSPCQLHPNSWAFIRAFQILCTHFGITPSSSMFLYFFELRAPHKQLLVSLSGVSDRALLTLYNSSYKRFKGIFIKIVAPDHSPSLLEGFPLYWCQSPNLQSPQQLEDMDPSEKKDYLMLEQLDVIFDTRKLLELEFRVVDLKFHIGTYFTTILLLSYT